MLNYLTKLSLKTDTVAPNTLTLYIVLYLQLLRDSIGDIIKVTF